MSAALPPLATGGVGSYPQPGWLVDPALLVGKAVPRVRATEVWRIAPEHLHEAIEAATLSAIADQQQAGLDVITDGEIGRESYFNHFANALGGVDQQRIGVGTNRRGGAADVPLVSGPIRRTVPIELDAARFLRANTTRRTKVTVPGPFTLSQLAQNEHYASQGDLAMAYAAAINEELHDLAAVGIDVLQLDEPYLQANAEVAADFAVDAISAALDGVTATTVVHTCYGYAAYVSDKRGGYPFFAPLADIPADYLAIEAAQPGLDPSCIAELAPRGVMLGVIDLGTNEVESPELIAARIRGALAHIQPAKLAVSPDCGMKFLPRDVARAKLAALVDGATIVRTEIEAIA
jgi:5-methyltetrahydropteroyltriglutamate--homocysteine methyltransferase